MNYRYHVFDPFDYIKLFYISLFNWSSMPRLEEHQQRIVLITQALILVFGMNLIVGAIVVYSSSKFNWDYIILGIVLGVILGVIGSIVFNDIINKVPFIVVFSVAFSVTWSLVCFFTESIVVNIVISVAVISVAVRIGVSVIVGMVIGVILSITIGVMVSIIFTIQKAIVGWIGWGLGLLVATIIGGIGFLVAIVIAGIILLIIEDWLKPHFIKSDWLIGMTVLPLLSIGLGYIFYFFDDLLLLNAPHPLVTAGLFFLTYSRLPLWPLEAFWARSTMFLLGHRVTQTQIPTDCIQWAYFDRHMILPLFGQASDLDELAWLDYEYAVSEAIDLALYSRHLLMSISALESFAKKNPLTVRIIIAKKKTVKYNNRILLYIEDQLPKAENDAWAIMEEFSKLENILDSKSKKQSIQFDNQFNDEENDIQQWYDEENGKLLLANSDVVQRATEKFELQPDENPKNVGPISTICKVVLQAAKIKNLEQMASFNVPVWSEKTLDLLPNKFPQIITQIAQVAQIIKRYQSATSIVNQRNAILGANKQLNLIIHQLDGLPEPIGPALKVSMASWINILNEPIQKITFRKSKKPVTNPYVAGNPVKGKLFVGRKDIMHRLDELWSSIGQVPSVVLYGHRRIGKTSILHNLKEQFGINTTVIDFNMQRVGLVNNTGELLYNLSLELYYHLNYMQQLELGIPDEERFLNHNPYTAFDLFLRQVDGIHANQRFIITVDEFELIEEEINNGQLEARLLAYWRGLIQTYPWFVMAFAGLHTLQEMTQDYWHPLFGSVTAIPVSFIRPKAARRLITQPTMDFWLDYDENAIERIIMLTNGQPYLIQLICHALVTRFNRQTFEEGVEREPLLSVTDVETVINAAEFYRDGHFYFIGVWGQAETGTPNTQTTVLCALAPSDKGLPLFIIAKRAKLPQDETLAALEALQKHDVVKEGEERWWFTVELMRRWVVEKKIGKE